MNKELLTAKVIDRITGEHVIGWNNLKSLHQLKERIVTIIRQPEDMLIVVEGMNPFLFIDFNIILGMNEESQQIEFEEKTNKKERVNMNIEEKLAFVRKALELGAYLDVNFHDVSNKKQAKEIAVELSKAFGLKHKQESHNGTHWYKLKDDDYTLGSAIFYDDYLKEDVDLSGMKEGEEIA